MASQPELQTADLNVKIGWEDTRENTVQFFLYWSESVHNIPFVKKQEPSLNSCFCFHLLGGQSWTRPKPNEREEMLLNWAKGLINIILEAINVNSGTLCLGFIGGSFIFRITGKYENCGLWSLHGIVQIIFYVAAPFNNQFCVWQGSKLGNRGRHSFKTNSQSRLIIKRP